MKRSQPEQWPSEDKIDRAPRSALPKYFAIGILILALWIGIQILQAARHRSRVESLPKKVAILGPYTARDGIAEAKRIASEWDADCQLQCIFLTFGGDVATSDPGISADGIPITPSGWNYRFYSASKGWFLDLRLWPDGRCDASSFNGINYRGTKPLPAEFLDSNAVFTMAEDLYGRDYRAKGKLFRIDTRLTTWPSPVIGPRDPVRHRAIWSIGYLTTRDRERVDLYLTLDAVTGKELSAVEFGDEKTTVLTNNYH